MKVICIGEYLEEHHSSYFHSYGFSDNVPDECSDIVLFSPDYTELLGEQEPFQDEGLLNKSSSRELLRRVNNWKEYLEHSVDEGAMVIVNCIDIRPIYICHGNSAKEPIKINNYSFFDKVLNAGEVTSSEVYKNREFDWSGLSDWCRPEVCINFKSDVVFKPLLYSESCKELYAATCMQPGSKGIWIFLPSFDLYRDFDVDDNLELTNAAMMYQKKLLNIILTFCTTNRRYFERKINQS